MVPGLLAPILLYCMQPQPSLAHMVCPCNARTAQLQSMSSGHNATFLDNGALIQHQSTCSYVAGVGGPASDDIVIEQNLLSAEHETAVVWPMLHAAGDSVKVQKASCARA